MDPKDKQPSDDNILDDNPPVAETPEATPEAPVKAPVEAPPEPVAEPAPTEPAAPAETAVPHISGMVDSSEMAEIEESGEGGEAPKEGQSKIVLIGGIGIVIAVIVLVVLLVVRSQTPSEPTVTPTPTPTVTETPTVEGMTFTDENFPDLEVNYDEGWEIESTTESTGENSDVENLTVVLTKDTATLTFNLMPNPIFGASSICFKEGEAEIINISTEVDRRVEEGVDLYSAAATMKDGTNLDGILTALQVQEAEWEDYFACGVDPGNLITNSAYINSDYNNAALGLEPDESVPVIFDIKLTFDGERDEDLVLEADEIIKVMKF